LLAAACLRGLFVVARLFEFANLTEQSAQDHFIAASLADRFPRGSGCLPELCSEWRGITAPGSFAKSMLG